MTVHRNDSGRRKKQTVIQMQRESIRQGKMQALADKEEQERKNREENLREANIIRAEVNRKRNK